MMDQVVVTFLALLSSNGFYALLIASIASGTTIRVVRELGLGEKYKKQVRANMKRNKEISTDLLNLQMQMVTQKADTDKVKKVIEKYKLDKQFRV